ncbi:Ubiquitin-conjugating enzyme E2, partial [Lachnellula hyalina]
MSSSLSKKSKTSSSSSSSSRTPTKRILTELSAFSASPHPTITSLAPSPTSLLHLHAILTSPIPAYSTGRWLLSITLPPNYPLSPPVIKFITRICHPNIKFETGEICLDLL